MNEDNNKKEINSLKPIDRLEYKVEQLEVENNNSGFLDFLIMGIRWFIVLSLGAICIFLFQLSR